MKLLLIRHAEAAPRESNDVADEDRPSSVSGRSQCRLLAEALQRRSVALGKLVSSPLLRARQTAEAILEHWPEPRPELLLCEALRPDGKDKKLTRFIRGLDNDQVTLVGHMPDLAEYAGWLIGDRKVGIHLAKAGVALIECEAGPSKGGGVLTWLAPPERW
jgi:phosphohistidine phosphatase